MKSYKDGKKVSSSALKSNAQELFFQTAIILQYAAKELYACFQFVTQNIKMFTQGLRMNKINNLYCFIKDLKVFVCLLACFILQVHRGE